MITYVIRRVMPLVGLAAIVGVLVGLQDVPAVGADAWLHLRLGHEFLSGGWSLTHPGHLGVYDTATWYPTQWASQVAMAWFDDRFGIGGVMWLSGTAILATPVVLYLLCRRYAAPLPTVLAVGVAVCAAAPGFSARPQVVSYLLIAVVMGAWLETARDGRPRWWLVPLAWVWVPLHGMWIVGITIGVAAVVGMALTREHPRGLLLRLAAIPVLSALVAFATPLGAHVVDGIAGVGSRNGALTEWDPPDFTSPNALFLVLMIVVVLVVRLRGGEPTDWPTLMLLGLAMAWGLYTLRTTIVAAVMLAPLLAMALQHLVPSVGRPGRREVGLVAAIAVLGSAAMAVVASQRDDDEVVAAWVDDRLAAMPAGTKVLNDWELGHYTMARHPQVQLVMHGYVDMFTTGELDRNLRIAKVEPRWDTSVEALDADYGFVDPNSAMGYALVHQLGWTEVEGDDDFVLLRPPADG
ncbi:hypothetical protein [Nocardioides zeicaulis]|uniref:Glycosyltransferase RgtA/B/C/D-like domain-containing protein n=1 Tax=Nocardioides zeicaulis TaxID=1776857 RepID=A0ABV6DXA5_9ACTN